MTSKLLLPRQLQQFWIRSYYSAQHNKKHYYKKVGNAQTYGIVKFYPKEKDFKDPEVPNPAKAFRVQRLVPLKGLPFWEIRILKDLGLVYNAGTDVAIVKNIPENNARLWKIKHCVSVDPIVFPYGEPTANDLNHTFLKQNGECIVTKEISIDPKRLEAAEKFINDKTRLDKDTLKRDALLKWVRNY